MRRILVVLVLALAALLVIFHEQVWAGGETALLISQVFPQIPVKPLEWITGKPEHKHITFDTRNGPVVADLFIPRPLIGSVGTHTAHAVVIAQGVKVPTGALSSFLDLGDGLARLGYVVLFPRLKSLAEGHVGLEYPETYVRSFEYLASLRPVDPRRISYFGISVGSSIALVAAANHRINHKVHGLVFFAGYYNIYDYLISLATKRDPFQDRKVRWHPSGQALIQVKAILKDKRAPDLLRVFQAKTVSQAKHILDSAPEKQLHEMETYNPASHLRSYHAPTFILDDIGDTFVPYVESEKLLAALPPSQLKAKLVTGLFHHVEPGQGGLLKLAGGFPRIFDFLYTALRYL